ncbi:centrosomal protein of 192 kDa-like [Discoglossus pictus]
MHQHPSVKQPIEGRIEPIGNGPASMENKANSSRPEDTVENSELPRNLNDGHKLDSLYFQKGDMPLEQSSLYKEATEDNICLSQMFFSYLGIDDKHSMSEIMNRASSMNDNVVKSLSDTYLSPTLQTSQKDRADVSSSWQPFLWNFGTYSSGEDGNPPHSVVYQNEEGKWVTDLAYYKTFDESPSFSEAVTDLVNDEEFIVGNDALAMIQEDEVEFEKENKFIQEEKMDLENLSLNMGDTSWKLKTSTNVLLRASQVASDLCQEDASYLRLSLGEFFGQRSEALGCLGGGEDVKRPSFGYHIISPEKQEPFALLKTSDLSEISEHEDTIKSQENTLTPEDFGCLPDEQKLASATFDIRVPENKDYVDRTVDIDQMDHGNIQEQSDVKENYDGRAEIRASDSMLLSISTIASAIANASSSADPSQLAAMIMALSNKNRLIWKDI